MRCVLERCKACRGRQEDRTAGRPTLRRDTWFWSNGLPVTLRSKTFVNPFCECSDNAIFTCHLSLVKCNPDICFPSGFYLAASKWVGVNGLSLGLSSTED